MTVGHPRWLLDLIADDVRRTYREPEFRYVYADYLAIRKLRPLLTPEQKQELQDLHGRVHGRTR